MATNYIALAVPVFLVGIGIELFFARRRGAPLYRFADALSSMSTGIASEVTKIFGTVVLLAGYAFVYDKYRLFDVPIAWAWLIAIIGVDFAYYWWHRLSHEVGFLWAAHVTHHSSEDYNLSTALRQSVFTPWTGWPFYIGLALVGVPPLVYATVHAFNTLYQFWIHTQLVGAMPRFESVLNSPSLHRVHHAINPRYLDKNYGGTFMVWDRLFGTYEPETEPCVYGIVKPLESFDPLWAQVHHYVELWRRGRALGGLDRLRVWWMPPTFQGSQLPPKTAPEVSPSTFVKFGGDGNFSTRGTLEFTLVLIATFLLLLYGGRLSLPVRAGAATLVILATAWCCARAARARA